MPTDHKLSQQEDLQQRIDQLTGLLFDMQQEIKKIKQKGKVAPPGCWLVSVSTKVRTVPTKKVTFCA